jgi:hypothetical protein
MVGARLETEDRTDAVETDALDKADLREAYERGRRDERAARPRHPLLMTLTFAAALIGVVMLVLAAVNGSFARAGGVVDEKLSVALNRAEPQVRDAASQAGQALRDAGESAKSKVVS